LRVGLDAAGVEHRDLVVFGHHLLGHDEFGEGPNVTSLGVNATRNSRAGPMAFLAAASKDSCTAANTLSRLMPFSRSQNSKTAMRSGFIAFRGGKPRPGNKKVGEATLPTYARWFPSFY
jgi:hypothetical protein